MTIGERIRQLREDRKMSQDELAQRCGYKSRSSINKIELSRKLPADKIEILAKALGTTPGYIMGWEEPAPSASAMDIARAFEEADVMTQEMVKRLLGYKEEFEKMIKGAKGEP
jgi:transcriptional regulator with XRE-family HTH domain